MSELTKKALAATLKKKLLEKPLDKITVGELASETGVNRQTFYYHFEDMASLVEYLCVEEANRVLGDKKTYGTWQEGFLAIFRLMQEDKAYINNIYHSVSKEVLEQYLYKIIFSLLRPVVEEASKGLDVDSKDKDFIAYFYKFAFCGVVLDWVKKGMVEDPSLLVKKVSDLMRGNFVEALKNYENDR